MHSGVSFFRMSNDYSGSYCPLNIDHFSKDLFFLFEISGRNDPNLIQIYLYFPIRVDFDILSGLFAPKS